MKVKCIETYYDNEMQRIINKGEMFEVSAARCDVLTGNNDYKTAFNLGKQDEVEHRIKHDEVSVFDEDK